MAFLRIEKRIRTLNDPNSNPRVDQLKDYLSRLVMMIPGEVVGLYMIGSGIIQNNEPRLSLVWIAFCLIMTVVVRGIATKDKPKQKPQYIAVFISAVSFLIWIYTIGGPFNHYIPQKKTFASLAVLAWTFIVPIFYKGDEVTDPTK